MFCMHCGQQLPTDAAFCPNCGRKVETASSDAPASNVPGQASSVNGGSTDEIDSGMNFALIITILALFNCGSFLNLALGIAAIAYANKVNRNLETGNREKAEECAKTAKTLCLIATCVIAFQIFVIFFFIALMALAYMIPFLIK